MCQPPLKCPAIMASVRNLAACGELGTHSHTCATAHAMPIPHVARTSHSPASCVHCSQLSAIQQAVRGTHVTAALYRPTSPSSQVSIASWNILADSLATPKRLPWVAPPHLGWKARGPALQQELAAMCADIVCLQEVDANRWAVHYASCIHASRRLESICI